MNITSEDVGTLRVVTVHGDRIDAAEAMQFKDQMARAADGAQGNVLLDLHHVTFVDSSGLGAIVAVMKQLSPDHRLDLAGLSPAVEKVFRLTRMDSVFRVHPDRESAVAEPRDAA